MGKKIILRVALALGILCGGTVAYASIFGEENITLVQQLSELMGISRNTYDNLAEARTGVDLALEARDDLYQARALVEELSEYTTDRFIADFKRDVLKTYPDLDYIINKSGSGGLTDWRASNMRTPMGSYELIGRVFGEVTEDTRKAQEEGRVKTENMTLYRYEAAASLTAAENANAFIDSADADIEVLVAQLNGATKEEAIVLQAKIQAVVAAQNSHLMRMQSLQLRRQGIEDARKYQRSARATQALLELEKGQRDVSTTLNKRPKMMEFDNGWMELE